MPRARNFPTGARLAAIAMALAATPALAAASSGRELANWLGRNTDLSPAQIAIVAPEYVYSLERIGSPLPSGEVMALVRTEVRAADWGAARGFQSWEANLLFDCRAGRVRILKSTVYPEPNRKGEPRGEPLAGDWFTPEPPQPATQLLAAACNPGFAWPLRASPFAAARPEPAPEKVEPKPEVVAVAPPTPPPTAISAPQAPPPEPTLQSKPQLTATAAEPVTPPPALAPTPEQYALQIVYSSSEPGARHSLARARTTLAPIVTDLSDLMQRTEVGRHRKRPRYTGYLSGFADAPAATLACAALRKAGQDCVVRPPGTYGNASR